MRKSRFTEGQMVAIIREADRDPVPALVGDRMFWGNDRLVLLEHYLARRDRR